MLSIARMPSVSYFRQGQDGARYYLKKSELPGWWCGRAGVEWALTGQIRETDFRRMYDGCAPDGPKVRNACSKSHFPGQDATNTWEKTFGIVCYSLRDPEDRMAFERCGWEANRDALQLFEDTGAWTRLGKGGHILEQAKGIVVGIFPHLTSRGVHDGIVDINPHYHNCIFTPVLCRDGEGRAMLGITQSKGKKSPVQSRSALYELKKTLGATFAESFARRVAALGYPVERTPEGTRWVEAKAGDDDAAERWKGFTEPRRIG